MKSRHFYTLALTVLLLPITTVAQEAHQNAVSRITIPPAHVKTLPPGGPLAIASSPRISLPALSRAEIASRAKRYRTAVGQNRDLPAASLRGAWTPNDKGQWVWSLSLRAADAAGIRLHFTGFDPGTGEVWVHDGSGDSDHVLGPYTRKGPMDDGEFWTELLPGDTVWLEYLPADGQTREKEPFAVTELFELWPADVGPNISCFLDETCYENNANVAQFSKAVALLLFPDHACSGTMIADRNGTQAPYLLTAGHCILNDGDARAMLAVFGFKPSSCNGPVNNYGSYPQVSGATLLARNLHTTDGGSLIPDQPDFAFVRLTQMPPVAVTLMGWAFNPSSADRMTSISHPRVLSQRLAAGLIISSSDSNFYTVNMSQGAVDHGSSGSGLANDSNQLVGVDSYGSNGEDVSACDVSDRRAGYTRFAAIYPAISQWLEAAAQPAAAVTPLALGFGNQQTGVTSGAQSVTIANLGKGTLSISGISIQGPNSAEFVETSKCGASLAANASCTVTVSFRPSGTGARTASLVIADNSAGSPQMVALSGNGTSAKAAPTVLNDVTSTVNGIASGSCRTPPSVSSFATTASAVWLYFDVTGAAASDIFHLSFYRPDGSLYTTFNAPSTYDGYVCFSYYMTVAGSPAASVPGAWSIRAFWNQSTTPLFTLAFNLTVPSTLPAIQPGGVVNSATLADGLTSGGFLTVLGSNLSTNGTQGWTVTGNKLPTATAGTQVLVNGKAAYVSYASPNQINAIAPADAFVGPVSVQVITAAGASTPATVTKRPAAPGLFMIYDGGRRYAVATLSDGAFAAPAGLISPSVRSRPARPGEVVALWATGLGATTPPFPDGQVITVQNRGVLASPYTVTIGGKAVQADWAGIVGAGLYQVNVQIPQLPPGDAAVQIVVNGVASAAGSYVAIGQ